MPIIIDDIIAKKGKTTTQLSPKFFSKDLTGKGLNAGVINRNVNPNILPRSSNFIPTEKFDHRKTVRVGPMKTQVLPLSPILKDIYENYQFHGNIDDFSGMFHAYSKTDKQGQPLLDIYYNLVPQGLVLYIEDLDGGGTDRTLYVLYREEIIHVANDTSTYYVRMQWDYAPGPTAASSLQSVISSVDAAATLDTKALEQWLDDFDVSDAITQQAELWTPDKLQDEIIPMISEMLNIIGTYINNNNTTAMEMALAHLATQLRFLETYNVPLETYREIYKVIANESPTPAIAQVLSKQNINLLISNTLDQLEKLKPQLPTPVLPQTLSGRFSPQQTAAITTEEPLVMLQAGAGSGKALINGTLIPVADDRGYVAIEDLIIGDKIFTEKGEIQTVTNVIPQGLQDAYELTFADNSTLIANDRHIFAARNRWARDSHQDFQNITLREMIDRNIHDTRGYSNWSIPVAKAVQRSPQELELDPYVLGATLGDGCLTQRAFMISSDDPDVVAKIATRLGHEGKEYKLHDDNYNWAIKSTDPNNERIKYLQTKDVLASVPELIGVKSINRFIPRQYLQGSIEQRMDLLQGLMDTDGSVAIGEGRNRIMFSTSSMQLAEDMTELLASLGIRSTMCQQSRARDNRPNNTEYTVHLKLPDQDKTSVFSLQKHIDKINNNLRNDRKFNKRYEDLLITNVENLDEKVPMTCISVSGESKLFLSGKEHLVSHNSTTVLGRIDNLIAGGVNPEDITVLSFTNAAADHISELNPNIGSMTIARMIHDIYCENYKNHNLSSIDTIINSLDIYFPNNQTANMFRRLLLATNKTEPGAITQLNNFIEINFDEVITILDTLGQTSLELEIIIAYQRIDDMIEPAHVKSKYLIIDEVQDNSVFEFIYILKYVAKHKENLYIVGDSSQTLYEFRSANPKALNALEASGIFATFKLTTNYRSNQEILDFANIHLADIEANQYAQIQLQANVLKPITADSFREKVGLKTQHISRVSKVDQELPDIIANNARSYIDRCLAKGQQVAMLAFTRRQVTIMQNTVQEMYPDRKVVNIVSLKSYPTTVFSMFIKKFWDQVTQVDPANAPYVITNQIQKNLKSLTRNYATAKEPVAQMIAQWWKEDQGHIVSWLSAYQSGAITKDQYFERLQKCVLDFEIRHNAIKAALLDEKKKQRKENDDAANADIIVSTIHGVKGLEFENVVLFMQYNSYEKEDTKRMQYVALTRAMHSELILAYSTKEEPGIKDDYEAIITALEENDTRRIA